MRLRVFLTVVGLIFGVLCQASRDHFPKQIRTGDYEGKLDTLRTLYGTNKTFAQEYELACLIALSGYPELKNTHIKFVSVRLNSTMAARPMVASMFRNRKSRKHKIFINTDENQEGLLLSEVSFNAQVGVIAHELGHIAYYINKSAVSLMGNSAAYVSKKFRGKFEHATDHLTIERGFGWQILAFIEETLASPKVSDDYKDYKKRVYCTPETIREEMKKLNYKMN